MDYYYRFKEWEKRTEESIRIKIVDSEKDNYIGFLQVKDIGEMVEDFMIEWVQDHQIFARANDFMSVFMREFDGEDNISEYRKRFVTYSEFRELFNSSLGVQLDNYIKSAEREEDEKSKAVREAYEEFYNQHYVYGLFKIKGERDRQRFALLCKGRNKGKDKYFSVMDSANKTLGSFFFALRRFRIPEKARQKHTYIVAGSGSGKSELLKSLIRVHLLKRKSSIIVLDPNGDFAEQVVKFKENATPEGKENIVYISPTLFGKGEEVAKVPIINLFDIDVRNLESDIIDQLVSTIFDTFISVAREAGSGMTDYTPNMQLILMPSIRLILDKEGGDLRDLIRLMDDERNSDLVEMALKSKNDNVREFFTTSFHQKQFGTAKQGINARLRYIMGMGLGRYLCGKTSVNIEEAMNQKKLIVLNLGKGVLGKTKSIIYGKFLLTYIIGLGFKRANIKEQLRVPCHLYIDEFHNYASDKLQESFEEGRKYKIYLTVVTQVEGQRLTRDMHKAIKGNTFVKIIGGAGRDTRTAMSKEMELDKKKIREITGIDEATLKDLKVGEFVVQVGNNGLPFKMINRKKTLGDKHSMSEKDWKDILERQKSLYYVEKQALTDEKINGEGKPSGDNKNNAEDTGEEKDLGFKYDL